jgi:sugar lactone lactonase YvrE
VQRRTLLAAAAGAPAALAIGAAAQAHDAFPAIIDLPNGWRPEGIATGRGTSFYVGSLANGAIFRGDLRTGLGAVFVAGTPGTQKTGLEIDHHDRIWACGASGGGASVHDGSTGAPLARYAFGGSFVNDAVATRDAVYFTDSQQPFLYVVPLGRHGGLPSQSAVQKLALPTGLGDAGAFNNGIESTPDGRRVIVVQSTANRLYTYDPRLNQATQVDLGGASVLRGDGLLRRGDTLYVVRNFFNLIAKFTLNADASAATLVDEIKSPAFDIPTTIGAFGPFLYACNARFSTPPTPTTTYNVVRVLG